MLVETGVTLTSRCLTAVNRLRARVNLEPVDELPRGNHDWQDCPVATALDHDSALVSIAKSDADISMWVHRFDQGHYPDHELEPLRRRTPPTPTFLTPPTLVATLKEVWTSEALERQLWPEPLPF